MNRTVLLLTHTRDAYVMDRVAEGLARRGVRAVRIDTDRYPTELDLQVGLTGGRIGDVDLDDVVGVWRRRIGRARLPETVPSQARIPIQREAQAHITAMLDVLAARGVPMVNPLHTDTRAEGHKSGQLAVARSVGLPVPPTLITNEPDAVRAFFHQHEGEVVTKLLLPFATSMEGGDGVPTSLLREADLAHLDGLRVGPMCFQRRIHASAELRIAWVDGRCFVGRQHVEEGVDWRSNGSGWRTGGLDVETEARINRLMQHYGLRYGALDLMVPADGSDPVFLEVNPSGEWGMLERDLGLPIGDALAAALLEVR